VATAPEGRATDRPHPEAVSSPPDEQGEQGDDHRADGDALPEVCVVGVQTTKRLADLCDVSLDHACVHARHHSARITHPHARVPMRSPRLCPCACARASPLPVPTRGGEGGAPACARARARDPQVLRVAYGLLVVIPLLAQEGVSPALLVVEVRLPLVVGHAGEVGGGGVAVRGGSHDPSMPRPCPIATPPQGGSQVPRVAYGLSIDTPEYEVVLCAHDYNNAPAQPRT